MAGLKAGAPWDVTFTPWTLRQVHKEEGAPDVWDDDADLLALEVSVAIRDAWPEQFLDAHLALFRARHDEANSFSTRAEVADVLARSGVDVDAVFEIVDAGAPRKEIATSWRRLSEDYGAFGVPTYIADGEAVFVRLMARPTSGDDAIATTERIVRALTEDRNLNEFKRPRIPR